MSNTILEIQYNNDIGLEDFDGTSVDVLEEDIKYFLLDEIKSLIGDNPKYKLNDDFDKHIIDVLNVDIKKSLEKDNNPHITGWDYGKEDIIEENNYYYIETVDVTLKVPNNGVFLDSKINLENSMKEFVNSNFNNLDNFELTNLEVKQEDNSPKQKKSPKI